MFWNVNVRGLFFGLILFYKKEYMICVVLEGVFYNLYIVYFVFIEVMNEIFKMIKVIGGFVKSEVWC